MRCSALRSWHDVFVMRSRATVLAVLSSWTVVSAPCPAWAEPRREINVHFRGMATLPVDFGPQVLAVRTPLGERATGIFRLSNMTGSTLAVRARFTTRPAVARKAFEPVGAFPVTRLRPHESRTLNVPFRVRTDLDARTPEIYVECVLEPVR